MENRTPKTDQNVREREAEATDEETFTDLEESFGDSTTGDSDNEDVPSPDGTFDEDDELNQAEPM